MPSRRHCQHHNGVILGWQPGGGAGRNGNTYASQLLNRWRWTGTMADADGPISARIAQTKDSRILYTPASAMPCRPRWTQSFAAGRNAERYPPSGVASACMDYDWDGGQDVLVTVNRDRLSYGTPTPAFRPPHAAPPVISSPNGINVGHDTVNRSAGCWSPPYPSTQPGRLGLTTVISSACRCQVAIARAGARRA